ncbi:ras-related protein Rab-33B [Peromyscus californicus insignis]|uniref:ras-related protein Rab-33B n=2 Tax=Peromyscus TaxID=10040 RepID=UPI0022A7A0CE|nr:ras-related protein Rab-33B [Peromyscus californicus insignis]
MPSRVFKANKAWATRSEDNLKGPWRRRERQGRASSHVPCPLGPAPQRLEEVVSAADALAPTAPTRLPALAGGRHHCTAASRETASGPHLLPLRCLSLPAPEELRRFLQSRGTSNVAGPVRGRSAAHRGPPGGPSVLQSSRGAPAGLCSSERVGRMASDMESSLEVSFSSSCAVSGASGCLPPARSRIFKIIVIGDSNVGKTCLTYRFCAGRFPDRTEATIGVDFRERAVEIDGERIKIQLWDTAGQERFRKSMVQHYYRNVHAVVFVYDMTNMASFHSLPSWIEECKQHLLANDIPRILVGNKCDLRSAIQVPTDLAQKFADTHSMPLFETSAKNPNDNDHVEAIFMTLAHKLKSHKPLMLSQPPDNRISLKPETKPAVPCWC